MKGGSNVVAFSGSEEGQQGYWGIIQTDSAIASLDPVKELVSSVVQLSIS